MKTKKHYYKNTNCYLCKTPFGKDWGVQRVRDHDHRTGAFRGAACQQCNINYVSNRFLPVFFHNLAGYDSHHILKQAYDICDELIEMKPARCDHGDPKGEYMEGGYKYDINGKRIYVPTKPEITCIPQTSEKFMTFSVGDIKFIDSFKFMATSLDKLVKKSL